MKLFLDTKARRFVKSAASNVALQVLHLKRRDQVPLEIVFVAANAVVQPPAGTTTTVGLKAKFSDANFLALAPAGTATLDIYTEPVEAAFATNPAAIPALLEVKWSAPGEALRTATLQVELQNSVILGDEGTPAAIPDLRATQEDAEAGESNEKWMTPLRTAQAIAVLAPPPTWESVTAKPTEFPPEAHTHPTSEITSASVYFEITGSHPALEGFYDVWDILNGRFRWANDSTNPDGANWTALRWNDLTSRWELGTYTAFNTWAALYQNPSNAALPPATGWVALPGVTQPPPALEWYSQSGDEEITGLHAEDARLQQAINSLGSSSATSIQALSTQTTSALADEQTARAAADSALSDRIDLLVENFDTETLDSIAEAAASINTLQGEIAGKAPASHTHEISEVTGLQPALDERLQTRTMLPLIQINGVNANTSPSGGKGGQIVPANRNGVQRVQVFNLNSPNFGEVLLAKETEGSKTNDLLRVDSPADSTAKLKVSFYKYGFFNGTLGYESTPTTLIDLAPGQSANFMQIGANWAIFVPQTIYSDAAPAHTPGLEWVDTTDLRSYRSYNGLWIEISHSSATQAALDGKADLDLSGLVPATQLPPISYQTTRHDGDGTTLAFAPPGTLTASDSPSAILVTINGVTQEPGSDYALDVSTNRIVLISALPLGDKIVITRPILLPSASTLTAEQLGALTATSIIDGGSF